VPLVYCLTANNDAASYNAIFDVLKQRASGAGQEFNPTTILSDFESGLELLRLLLRLLLTCVTVVAAAERGVPAAALKRSALLLDISA